jgi:2-enoate reductase
MKLFETGTIGELKLKNRIIMAPMEPLMYDPDGGCSSQLVHYFAERAKGGVAMVICCGLTTIRFEGPNCINFERPECYERLVRFIDEMHQYDCKVCCQLGTGSGRVAFYPSDKELPPAASAIANFWDPKRMHRPFTLDEIQFLVEAYGKAAAFVKSAGADVVEVHAEGGYLVDQFMTPLWNMRKDDYGGDFEGRMRFPLDLISEIQKTCGEDFPIIFKFVCDHMFEGGRTMDEGIKIAKRLEEAGVHALHADIGCYETWYRAIPPIYEYQENPHASASAQVKRAVGIPVLSAGKLGDPKTAEEVLKNGAMDFVALGRPLLSDPAWVNKVKENHVEDIIPCIGCNEGCMKRIFSGLSMGCAVNPMTGKENKVNIKPVNASKSILVIGGGPAGMEAAITAAKQGHHVALWEKSGHLGGNLIAAGAPDFKKDIKTLIDYYKTQIYKTSVNVHCLKEATPKEIIDYNADLVVVASGSNPVVPNLPGIHCENVSLAVDVLTGKSNPMQNTVVIGGGLVGIETALYLYQQGKSVTIIEMQDEILKEALFPIDTFMLKEMLSKTDIKICENTKLVSIGEKSIAVEADGRQTSIACDSVVLALGFRSEARLMEILTGKVHKIVKIGDASTPRKILNAVWEGFDIAISLK